MTYAEMLKSQGATEDDVKLLATPLAERVYAKQQADLTAATAAATKATQQAAAYQKWHDEEATPYVAKLEIERNSARVEAAAANARIKAAQDAGLLEVADDAAARAAAADAAAKAGAMTFDPTKHNLVTGDTFSAALSLEADAIATAQDISYEHSQLFPGKPLNFRELRKEALSTKTPIETLWMNKYGVQAARDARATADKAAEVKRIKEEGVNEYRSTHSVTNPMTGIAATSVNPFTGKVPSASDAPSPWLRSDSEKVNSRVNKVLGAHPEIAVN